MGPLVPDIISGELNYIIALIVGIGFGFALEQAGFASTKKLVGLFYGYDFTVLRVFFTAGITAMVGIIVLNHLDLLDIDIIYINPTFLWSALIGGGIMGLGFIIGGFCPGTSACAAATGRVDGMAFLFGSVIGIFIFGEGYPVWEGIYTSENWGAVLMFDQLNLSRETFGLLMILIASFAFIMTQIIENRINNKETKWFKPTIIKNTIAIATPIIIVLFVMVTPTKKEVMDKRINEKIAAGECNPKIMKGDKLAYELMNQYYKFNVVDVRSPEEYEKFHIPTAINIPLETMHKSENLGTIIQNIKINVFYGADIMQSQRACMISKYFGKSDNFSLELTADEFNQQYFLISEVDPNGTKESVDVQNFRIEAGKKLKEIGEAVANLDKPVVKKAKRVSGGCS
ncbi:rhodanese-like domain-containing protein [Plebeiibacterium marinum]|uniref:Rhodanese-like domain-containing protein n=1 Tax=Plebeiibacterium marinum TaxID=2992111 RepID=A0AAE3SK79_9BACT|nr:rhodanese-like domain-containing protein [Plebeiobacterium marinum]MCW3806332.1 rhodanese-like domain-containing protein [Plebeiobacterium marinum]